MHNAQLSRLASLVVAAKNRSNYPKLVAFGEMLTELRGRASREQISLKLKRLKVPLGGSTLAQYERGAVWAPDAGVLWGLATIYDYPLERMVELLKANRTNPKAANWHDLSRHVDAERSASNAESSAPAPSALSRLQALRTRDRALAGSVRDAVSALTAVAVQLEKEDGGTGEKGTSSHPRDRKAG